MLMQIAAVRCNRPWVLTSKPERYGTWMSQVLAIPGLQAGPLLAPVQVKDGKGLLHHACNYRSSLNGFFRSVLPPPCIECGTVSAHTVRPACGHRICSECILRLFECSIADPEHSMPPRCCLRAIALGSVRHIFPDTFIKTWKKKYRQVMERIPCPAIGCGARVQINKNQSGNVVCLACGAKVCQGCKLLAHIDNTCAEKGEEDLTIRKVRKATAFRRDDSCSGSGSSVYGKLAIPQSGLAIILINFREDGSDEEIVPAFTKEQRRSESRKENPADRIPGESRTRRNNPPFRR